jgi:predicted esterase
LRAMQKDCKSETGWPKALAVCSSDDPCVLPTGKITEPVDTGFTCKTPDTAFGKKRPQFDDGAPKTHTDMNGLARPYCEFRPSGTSPESPRPLLLWFHGGSGKAQHVYESTLIRAKAESFDLSHDPARPGFILVSVQGRNLHWPTTELKHESHHDFYYRDLASPSQNPDVAFADQIIDELVSAGVVDKSRIYLSGISNGGFFSQLYGIARHERSTPGGNRVAAAAIYSAADPFQSPNFAQGEKCQLAPYPKSAFPIHLHSRACDLIACNAAQLTKFRNEGRGLLAPGFDVTSWMDSLKDKVENNNATWQIISIAGAEVDSCTLASLCTYEVALINHINWPDGINDASGKDYEIKMLEFLRNHPLP